MPENEMNDAQESGEPETTGVVRSRRKASRPAGPPPDVEDTPAVISVSAAPVPAEQPAADGSGVVVEGGGEVRAGRVSTRPRRAVRATAAPDPEQETAPAEPRRATRRSRSAAAETADAAPAVNGQVEEAEPAAERPRRSRRRATAAPEVAEGVAESVETPEAAAEEEAPKRATRTRSRSRRRAEPEPEPVAEDEEELVPVSAEDVLDEDITESLDEDLDEEELDEDAAGVPSVTFQPPMVVFQPPVAPRAVQTRPARPEPAAAEDEDEDGDNEDVEDGEENEETGRSSSRRRRRRGGRGRGKAAKDQQDDESAEDGDSGDHAEGAADSHDDDRDDARDDEDGSGGGSRRRRRRRRRGGSGGDDSDDLPPNTVVHVRQSRGEDRPIEDEVQSVRGSTRLEAKKQRRREGREQGRRRPPIITESEFLARRESVERVMVVRSQGDRTQIAVIEDGALAEHHVDRASHQSYVGNVYLGKVQNVLPSMEAAFVDIGKGRNAVLYAGEVNWDVAGMEGQPRRIEAALKSGQAVLVQVTKDPVGHKGARLTSQISLPGRYLVYVPDGSMTGISRKLPDKERSRLKAILKKVMPENAGVIVRTAAEGASEEELSQDVSRLAAQWEQIQVAAKTASAPSLLHGEPDLTIRVVRDIFNEDFSKLVVAGEAAWDTVEEYVDYVAPHLADRVSRWTESKDAFEAYRIDEQIGKALERKVWLPSGGSLVIDRTEAMTVIDVNTGKFTGQGGNLEQTVTRNNLEAAEEIVRQLRLRDIGGIIVVDFIDMVLESNRDLVLRRLLECLSRDRTKHQVAEVTSLGLVQMTRKRVGTGLLEAFSEPCDCCNGRGVIVNLHPGDGKQSGAGEEKAESGSGRRRKRKGEVEKVVEHKLAKHEASKIAEVAKAAERNGEDEAEEVPEEVSAEAVETEVEEPKPKRARRSRATKPAGPPPEDGEPAAEPAAANAAEHEEAAEEAPAAPARARARRTRRTPATRAKAEVGADEGTTES